MTEFCASDQICCSCGSLSPWVVTTVTRVLGRRNEGSGLLLILVTQLPGLPAHLDLEGLNPWLPGTKLSAGSPAAGLMGDKQRKQRSARRPIHIAHSPSHFIKIKAAGASAQTPSTRVGCCQSCVRQLRRHHGHVQKQRKTGSRWRGPDGGRRSELKEGT